MKEYISKFDLTGKIAFITGGLGLIGREIIKAFASSGATTIILDIDDREGSKFAKEMQSDDFEIFYEQFDITSLENVGNEIKVLSEKYKGIDVWVNCAYPRTTDWGNRVEDVTLESWRENVDIHFNSYCWISREVCLAMKNHKKGSLINFGSTYGVRGNDFNIYSGTDMTSPIAYSAIKGGIINLTRYLASYFGADNIRVNNVCPGGIFDGQDPIFVKNYSKRVPLKRMGKPDEIASTVLFLASDAASYITGATIMVDGGWTAI